MNGPGKISRGNPGAMAAVATRVDPCRAPAAPERERQGDSVVLDRRGIAAAKAIDVARKAVEKDQHWVRTGHTALDPTEDPAMVADPVVRDLRSAETLLCEVKAALGRAAAQVATPEKAANETERALEAHVKAVDLIRAAIRNLREGPYGRLGPAELAALEAATKAEGVAIFTQTRIVLATDALLN
ncbi:MAG: DUF2379 family protein [Candidatus Sericytochromatia bacterium]|uniref:DUF2379 family protein n=1 Tax=Candidatus Tanganyikabacteria bacterium TaxID=2961651 RepID=A0A938BKK3_9BACT|nr:DUF2379 family protein [Candidatus Tanganyikabacteria bacterium]